MTDRSLRRVFVIACAGQAVTYVLLGILTMMRPEARPSDGIQTIAVAGAIVAGLLLSRRWRRAGELLALGGTLIGFGAWWVIAPPVLALVALVAWLLSFRAQQKPSAR